MPVLSDEEKIAEVMHLWKQYQKFPFIRAEMVAAISGNFDEAAATRISKNVGTWFEGSGNRDNRFNCLRELFHTFPADLQAKANHPSGITCNVRVAAAVTAYRGMLDRDKRTMWRALHGEGVCPQELQWAQGVLEHLLYTEPLRAVFFRIIKEEYPNIDR